MPFDSDVALLGTGLGPLIAASHFLAQGKSVLLLNPDRDYFLEDSELPLDPLLPLQGAAGLGAHRIARSLPENALETLRPYFPGALEFWSGETGSAAGFHDPEAPHLRSRARLWTPFVGEELEALYVEASDLDLHPQILDGLRTSTRFPGMGRPRETGRGLWIPRLCDLDVSRYRNGVLEFVRERVGPDRVICEAGQVELMPGGARFHSQGAAHTARVRDGILVFWTPRMSAWVLGQAHRSEVTPVAPGGARLWEQWKVFSRDALDPSVAGNFDGGLTVWADVEGAPNPNRQGLNRLSILRAGPRVGLEEAASPHGGTSWASEDSFSALSALCHDFLRWDRFSVLSLAPRTIFEWDQPVPWSLSRTDDRVQVVSGCDGPVVEVVRNSRDACLELEKGHGTR